MIFTKPRDRNKSTVTTLVGIERVTSLKVLGVTLSGNFSMTEHVAERIASSGQCLYALKILRSHGLDRECTQLIFKATVIAKLAYASPPGGASPTPTISSDSSHSCEEVSRPDIIPPNSHTSVKYATLPTTPSSTPSHPIHTIHCSVFSRPRSSDNTI